MTPFGKYAGIVAAGAAFLILGGWIVSALHIGGAQASPQLDAAALVILGAIFGTGAGALTVSNGAAREVVTANTRLDAIGAPSGPVATAIVANGGAPSAPLGVSVTTLHNPNDGDSTNG